MIKPEFFDDPDIGDLSLAARLLFIGLWTQADRDGRLVDDVRRLKVRLFPFDDDVDVEALVQELHAKDMIRRYRDRRAREKPGEPGKNPASPGYIWIRNFTKHQRPHVKEPESLIPQCDDEAREKPGEPGKNPASPQTKENGFLILDPGTQIQNLDYAAPAATVSVSYSPPPGLHVTDAIAEKAGAFLRRYPEIYAEERKGAHFRILPVKHYPTACELVAGWPDLARLELMLRTFLRLDDPMSRPGTPAQLLHLAPAIDARLRDVGSYPAPTMPLESRGGTL